MARDRKIQYPNVNVGDTEEFSRHAPGSVDTKMVGEVGEKFHASAAIWLRLDLQTCTGVSRCREREARWSGGGET